MDNFQDNKFPNTLYKITGGVEGVKKIFSTEYDPELFSIETSIIKKLKQWIDSLLDKPESTGHIVILVGGPGNGKTKAVNDLLIYLMNKYFSEKSLDFYKTLIPDATNGKRSFEFDLSNKEIFPNEDIKSKLHFKIVVDASQGTDECQNVGQLLITDLKESIKNEDKNLVYIACVNKGVLSDSFNYIDQESGNSESINELIKSVISQIIKASTITSNPIECWPLETPENTKIKNWPQINIWPMDIESLFDIPISDEINNDTVENKTIFSRILKVMLDEKRWVDFEPNNQELNPYIINTDLLKNNETSISLEKILHWFEYSVGKRFCFREIYSLLSHILADHTKLLNKKYASHIDWVNKSIANYKNINSKNRYQSLFELYSGLYYTKLFSFKFTLKEITNAKQSWKKVLNTIQKNYRNDKNFEIDHIKKFIDALFKYITITSHSNLEIEYQDESSVNNTIYQRHTTEDIYNLLSKLDETLSPIDYIPTNKNSIIDSLYSLYSRSIAIGNITFLNNKKIHLSTIENDILSELASIDNILSQTMVSQNEIIYIRPLQIFIRKFACYLIRLKDGVLTATVKNENLYEEYIKLLNNSFSEENYTRKKEIKTLKKLLFNKVDKGYEFKYELNKTFGQPSLADKNTLILIAPDNDIKPHLNKTHKGSRPHEIYPFYDIILHNDNIITIPLTFDLFKAIKNLENKLNVASLPKSVLAMIDKCKSLILGADVIARNNLVQNEKVYIEFGDKLIIYDGNTFEVRGDE